VIGYCNSIRAGRSDNMRSGEVLSILCFVFLLCAYSLSLPCCELSCKVTRNFGIHIPVIRSSRTGCGQTGEKMAEIFQKLVESLQAEVRNLRAQISSGRPTTAKDLSLVSLIPKWSGTEKSVSVEEFFESVESSARIGNWSDPDKIQISILKISEVAKAFFSSSPELHKADIHGKTSKQSFCTDSET